MEEEASKRHDPYKRAHAHIHTCTNVDTYRGTHDHLHMHMHAHTHTQLHTYKPRNLANIWDVGSKPVRV